MITLIAAILLLVPVFVLFKLQPTNKSEIERKSNYQIVTVFAFTLFFLPVVPSSLRQADRKFSQLQLPTPQF